MRKKILLVLYIIAYYTGIIAFFYFINRRRQRVFVFHHIIPDECINNTFEQSVVCTPLSKFNDYISLIKKRFKITTSIGEPDTAVLTFDDGYRAALLADSVLAEAKAYFFMPLKVVDSGPLWIDQVMSWFAYVPDGKYEIEGGVFELYDQKVRQVSFSKIINRLYENYDVEALVSSLNDIYPFEKLSISKEYYQYRFKGMTSDELEKMKLKGHKIGGHSINHDILSKLGEDVLRKDFETCSQRIGKLYNTDVYAYPYGHQRDVDKQTIRLCRESSFKYAFLNDFYSEQTDYTLSRINISHYNSKYEVEASMSGFTQWLKKIIQ